jgi:urocanate hydratase
LTFEPPSQHAFDFVAGVARAYASLVESPPAHPETGLGGKLFYVGELDGAGRALLVAANIAGAATLAATADPAAQKQALRDGVADFVVNNLDEALRILKNQLRKRETVAVCVALPPSEMEREMSERGVAPDLLRRDVPVAPHHEALRFHESEETEFDLSKIPAVVTWRVDSALPKDLAQLDEIALTCLDPGEWQARRWLRLAPRYLGRMAQGLRLLDSNREFAARFSERVFQFVERGEIAFAFEIVSHFRGIHDQFRYAPTKP